MRNELQHDWRAMPIRPKRRPINDLLTDLAGTAKPVKPDGAAND